MLKREHLKTRKALMAVIQRIAFKDALLAGIKQNCIQNSSKQNLVV